jgi:hypothetical protein
MNDAWTAIGVVMVVGGITTAAVVVARMLMDLVPSRKRKQSKLRKTLAELGWEPYRNDMWRNRKTGMIMSFPDAAVKEPPSSARVRPVPPGKNLKDR